MTIPQDLRISSPPGIEPGISCLGPIPLATMLYRRGLCSFSVGRTGGVVLAHGASQPSPGFEPPPAGWVSLRMPLLSGREGGGKCARLPAVTNMGSVLGLGL